ncbi:MAG: hypothetical protein JWL77_4926 [Chthonomonadaceae bacterium]|nr:hypothetical protein [Chthonomonadaceae bacterium]
MRKPGVFVAILTLLAVGALLFRLPALDNRPMHGDEAVHAFKFRDLWEKGVYRYDPNEYHGPTIYYAELPVVWLKGIKSFNDVREGDYRLPTVVFGAAMLLLLIPLHDALGKHGTLVAALLLAVSPAFVFYSRDYIQEILLAFFTLGMLACGWRYIRSRKPAWLIGAGISAGLMIATKETAVVTFLACGLGLGLTALWSRRVDGQTSDSSRDDGEMPGESPDGVIRETVRAYGAGSVRRRNIALIGVATGIALLTACLVLTNFFRHPGAMIDYLRAFTPWLGRAHGTNVHRHPWNYYLQMLVWWKTGRGAAWSEGLIVALAMVGMITALLPKTRGRLEGSIPFCRFVTFSTLILTAGYSAISYKTPWCVLSFLLGMILMAGFGAVALLRWVPGFPFKPLLALGLLVALGQLSWQSYRTSYVAYVDEANPYVYAQPVPDVLELAKQMQKLSHAFREHDAMVVKIVSKDEYYWPIPWYIRQFPNQGYYIGVPDDVQAPIVLADPDFDDLLTKKLGDTHLMNHIYGLRPGTFFEIWIRMDVWSSYLEWKKTQPQPKEDPVTGEPLPSGS